VPAPVVPAPVVPAPVVPVVNPDVPVLPTSSTGEFYTEEYFHAPIDEDGDAFSRIFVKFDIERPDHPSQRVAKGVTIAEVEVLTNPDGVRTMNIVRALQELRPFIGHFYPYIVRGLDDDNYSVKMFGFNLNQTRSGMITDLGEYAKLEDAVTMVKVWYAATAVRILEEMTE
ncbi:hypothetical protein ACFLRA_03465, partial [Bdellovibrionota bacterium]